MVSILNFGETPFYSLLFLVAGIAGIALFLNIVTNIMVLMISGKVRKVTNKILMSRKVS